MTTPPDGPQQSFTTQDIDLWLLAAAERHAAIYDKVAQPWQGQHLYEAFADMSGLCLEALEEVRV